MEWDDRRRPAGLKGAQAPMVDNLTKEPLPQGLALTALDPEYRADPYPRLKALQQRCPVQHDEVMGILRLTRYADVRAVLTDRSLWRDPMRADPASPMHQRALREQTEAEARGRDRRQSILTADDPDHGRVRGLITPVLYKRFAAARDMVDRVVRGRLDRLQGQTRFDLIQTFAIPIPIEVIAHMLGVDETRLEQFRGWSEAIIHTFNPARTSEQTAEMNAAADASMLYLDELMAARRKAPRDDLVSDLVQLQAEGANIDDAKIRINCNTLLIAGNLTTTDLIGNGVRLLLTHPGELAKLKADPSLIGSAVEEILRFDPPVDSTGRVASREMQIGGCPVQARDPLGPSLRAANRDPETFPDPDHFDITRRHAPHVAFGGGAHICLGAPLARIEAQSALLGLFEAFPNLGLVDEPAAWRALPFFRGLERLNVVA
jgi:cytochrome P450